MEGLASWKALTTIFGFFTTVCVGWIGFLNNKFKKFEASIESNQTNNFKLSERITILESTSVHRDHLSDTMKEFKEEFKAEMEKSEDRQERKMDEIKDSVQENMSAMRSEIRDLIALIRQ